MTDCPLSFKDVGESARDRSVKIVIIVLLVNGVDILQDMINDLINHKEFDLFQAPYIVCKTSNMKIETTLDNIKS